MMSLKEAYPQFARQWHPRLNQGRSAKDVSATSKLIYFWKCRKGPDHEVNNLGLKLVCSLFTATWTDFDNCELNPESIRS